MADECCPQLNKEDWDLKFHHWDKRAFYMKKHGQFLHMPIGISKAIKQGAQEVKKKGYEWDEPFMILQEELSSFSARELLAIKGLPEDENVVIFEPRDLYSKYYHGSFAGIKKQINELLEHVKKEGKEAKKIYLWTVDCPKCWKKRGGPSMVIFAEV